MREERRVRLGVVGVDSGQLLLIDPGYLESEWRRGADATPHGLRFWGRDAEQVSDRLTNHPLVDRIERTDEHGAPVYVVHLKPPEVAEDVDPRPLVAAVLWRFAEGLTQMKAEGELFVVWQLADDSTYQAVGALTGTPDHGGQLNYQAGHAGLGVALDAGGDGVHEVWATIRGDDVVRVEVALQPEVLDDEDAEAARNIQAELVKLQDMGAIEYVVPTDPLGEEWVIGAKGQIIKLRGISGALTFLAGVTVVTELVARKTGFKAP